MDDLSLLAGGPVCGGQAAGVLAGEVFVGEVAGVFDVLGGVVDDGDAVVAFGGAPAEADVDAGPEFHGEDVATLNLNHMLSIS